MKKLFVLFMLVAIAIVSVNAQTSADSTKKAKAVTPWLKGKLVLSSTDSTATYVKSDSVKFADMIPAGFKKIQKPR